MPKVTVDGQESNWNTDRELTIGNYGTGSVNILAGGEVTTTPAGRSERSPSQALAKRRIVAGGGDWGMLISRAETRRAVRWVRTGPIILREAQRSDQGEDRQADERGGDAPDGRGGSGRTRHVADASDLLRVAGPVADLAAHRGDDVVRYATEQCSHHSSSRASLGVAAAAVSFW